ncbi:TPA: hypothetical protein N0F65_004284 [Lagenidium giganteum]|uniref:HECT domain-containing protein n=1 Tax=Lagenidium giganteum TaxID=4803 RepID=A0AAV2ZD20_9STRA|nr:TPA: hypothetical protein N0F65_004284 [Lagenidium giganteum]
MEPWLRQAVDVVEHQLSSNRAGVLYENVGAHACDAATGGAIFWSGLALAQLGQKVLGVAASSPVLPRCIGIAAVAASSAAALQFSSLPRELYGDLHESVQQRTAWAKTWGRTRSTIQRRLDDTVEAPYPIYMVMGVICFKMLGGRMRSIAPSHYANLGAFHLKKASLPATEAYANSAESMVIQEFGRLFGCHTCGVKRNIKFHADHMPPKAFAKRANESFVRKLFGQKVAFRFYPQCAPCSNKQAHVVKFQQQKLRTHFSSLRLYHTTGIWLILLCSGGIYVGESSFQDIRPTPTVVENVEPSRFTNKPDAQDLLSALRELRRGDAPLTKEERLRFHVLKSIDQRETLIYQLNALILCTPAQESLLQLVARPPELAKPAIAGTLRMQKSATPDGPTVNYREATRIAQQLAADLQIAGIQCVEALVEWMLEAGAKAANPPPFLWRGQNYMQKMYSDLDFAESELRLRGVQLDCYTQHNPLLLQPDQKLGRALAAQSIILEMLGISKSEGNAVVHMKSPSLAVVVVQVPSLEQNAPEDPPDENADDSLTADQMILRDPDDIDERSSNQDEGYNDQDDSAEPRTEETPSRQETGESERFVDPELDSEYGEEDHRDADDVNQSNHAPSPTYGSEDDFEDAGSPQKEKSAQPQDDENEGALPPAQSAVVADDEAHGDLVAILDESMSEYRWNKTPQDVPAEETPAPSTAEVLAGDTPNQTEDGRGDDENEVDSGSPNAEVNKQEPTTPQATEGPAVESPAKKNEIDSSTDSGNAQQAVSSNELLRQTLSQHAGLILLEGELAAAIAWGDEQLGFLDAAAPAEAACKESLVNLMATSGILSSADQLSHFLSGNFKPLLATTTWSQGRLIVNSVFKLVGDELEQKIAEAIEDGAEVEAEDLVESINSGLSRVHASWWSLTNATVSFHRKISAVDVKQPTIGDTPTQLARVFAIIRPFVTALTHEKQVQACYSIVSSIEQHRVSVRDLAPWLDPAGKALLLGCEALFTDLDQSSDMESFPKLTIVCARDAPVQTSLAVLRTHLAATKLPHFVIYPFFQSTFGEKIVDGAHVEEGEGKGPLKEWFNLVVTDLSSRWMIKSTTMSGKLILEDHKLSCPGGLDEKALQAGCMLEWEAADGTVSSRTVVKCIDNATVMLDRPVQERLNLEADNVRVLWRQHEFVVFVEASDSYWLNDQTEDSQNNQDTLRFLGWLLANVIRHHVQVDITFCDLFWQLLLRPDLVLTLDDIESFDPALHESLAKLAKMPHDNFSAFLDMEGLSTDMSFREYVAAHLQERFGEKSSFAWQMDAIRRGFASVYELERLEELRMTAADLKSVVCASQRDVDFDVRVVFRTVEDPELVKSPPLRTALWKVISELNLSEKRRLVKFVTGVDALPPRGSEFFRVEMPFTAATPDDYERLMLMLPQAHTCDNTLELPNYMQALCHTRGYDKANWPAEGQRQLEELVRKKLCDAMDYAGGYGLDGTNNVSTALASRPKSAAAAAQDSCESLDLPGLDDEGGDDTAASPVATAADVEKTDVAGALPALTSPATKPKAVDDESYGDNDWEEEAL